MKVYEAILKAVSKDLSSLAKARVLFECLEKDVLLSEIPETVEARLDDIMYYLAYNVIITANHDDECSISEFELKNYDVPLALAAGDNIDMASLVASILISMDIYKGELRTSVFFTIDDMMESIDKIARDIANLFYYRIKETLELYLKEYIKELSG